MISRGWTGLRRRIRRPAPKEWWLWVALIVAVLVAGSVLSWVFWECLHDNRESVSSTVRNLGLLIGAAVAALLAVWRSRVAERQADAAQRQVEAAQQGLLSERYRQGTEMLGHKLKSVRLGGIYTLDRLATDYPDRYHILVMQTLCAFVRHPPTESSEIVRRSNAEQPAMDHDQEDEKTVQLREDVHAVLQAIRMRSPRRLEIESKANFELDFSGADLRRSDLRDASLSGDVFRQSRLSGSLLMDADLSGAHLQYADLTSPNLGRLTKVTTKDIAERRFPEHTRLDNADLTCALAMGAKMRGVILSGADLSGASLSFVDLADSCLMDADLSNARLSNADLTGSELHDAKLAEAILSEAVLSGTDFSGSFLFGLAVSPRRPVVGLTQKQLDTARADPSNPPKLDGVLDAITGEQLVWRGRPIKDSA